MKIQELLFKEDGLEILSKMDAIGLQGVWLDFPGVASSGGKQKVASYLFQLHHEEAKKRKNKKETPEQKVKRLLKKVEKRMMEEDSQDLLTILAL